MDNITLTIFMKMCYIVLLLFYQLNIKHTISLQISYRHKSDITVNKVIITSRGGAYSQKH